jgi:signal transduction histidine kinase
VLSACGAAAEALGYEPEVTFKGAVDTLVPSQVGDHLLAVLRETLSNTARHAGATAVRVEVTASSNRVLLLVTDNGKGLAEGGRRSGLANLENRAVELGGTFRASARDSGGTQVSWDVPLRR